LKIQEEKPEEEHFCKFLNQQPSPNFLWYLECEKKYGNNEKWPATPWPVI
jgi:hypothetical protein